jgi:hypothetical protein
VDGQQGGKKLSRITLSGNASGTGNFTLASPNSNTDRTLTLPDATGTVNVSGLANEVPAGSAGAPAIYPTGDSNTGIFFPAADTIAFSEGGAEVARFDASGNLGLGVTPSAWNASFKAYQVGNQSLWSASGANGYLSTNGFFNTSGSYIYRSNGFATEYIQSTANGSHSWHTAPSGTAGNAITFTQAMTLDVNGNLLVGTTTFRGRLTVEANSALTAVPFDSNDTRADAFSSASFIFRRQGTQVGSISTTTSATSYVTSSDYRLKEDWQPMAGASERLMDLKPVNFAWKVDGSRVDGFLAHEAQAVVPEAVTGEKDAVDADGNPQYQGIDQSKLVPLLTAALQEALTEIASMKARITALEAN